MEGPLLAIFVGGRSSRMGTDKGLLPAPGKTGTLLESLVHAGRQAKLEIALIGEAAPYAGLVPELPRVDDRPVGAGPLGGLSAAFGHAQSRGLVQVVAVACDMPHVSASVLRMLAEHRSNAAVIAPKRDDEAPWEPMLARYDVVQVAPVLDDVLRSENRSFQALFETVGVERLTLTDDVSRALLDWDTLHFTASYIGDPRNALCARAADLAVEVAKGYIE